MVTAEPSPGGSLTTPFCAMAGVRHPIVLGGMGSPSTSPELVAAVCNAGGLGILGCSGFSADQIRENAARIRALTEAPFGLNLLLFFATDEAIAALLAERPRVASFAWPRSDQPLAPIFDRARAAGCVVMHMVSDMDGARSAAEAGADIVVAQGTDGGGHVGLMGTMPFVPQVVDAVAPRPVLAAGGIADGRGLAASLMLGASGALLGTRFLATVEAPIPDGAKEVILGSDGHDTELTEIPDLISGRVWPGALARTWRNGVVRQWSGREWELRLRRPEVAAAVAAARTAGDYDQIPILFGQDAGLIDAIEPVAVVMERIVRDASDLVSGGWRQRLTRDATAGGAR
jgi:NAD(P)H-dependent flavin oxidoreductase YrpB (nitropropane dioxygenase family)